jgi:hypothetical protein
MAIGSTTGGNDDLQIPQRPVLARYLAGMRYFCPQWLQARVTGIQVHRQNRRAIGLPERSDALQQQNDGWC